MVDMFGLDDKIGVHRSQLNMAEIAKLLPQVNELKKNILLTTQAEHIAQQGHPWRHGRFLNRGQCSR